MSVHDRLRAPTVLRRKLTGYRYRRLPSSRKYRRKVQSGVPVSSFRVSTRSSRMDANWVVSFSSPRLRLLPWFRRNPSIGSTVFKCFAMVLVIFQPLARFIALNHFSTTSITSKFLVKRLWKLLGLVGVGYSHRGGSLANLNRECVC